MEMVCRRRGYTPEDWKPGRGGEVRLWIMEPGYAPKLDKYAGADRDTAPPPAAAPAAVEIATWRGRRVFLWGGGDDWPTMKADILAALKATDPPAAETQPATQADPWAAQPAALPGSAISHIRDYLHGGEIFAVMEAAEDPQPEAIEDGVMVVAAQQFKDIEFLGSSKIDLPVRITYRCESTEGPVLKGRRVLWVAGHPIYCQNQSVQLGIKAYADTPANRRAIAEAISSAATQPAARWPKESSLLLPGSRVPLAEALEGKGRLIALCRAVQDGFGMTEEQGVVRVIQKFKVIRVLSGASPATEVTISYTQFDVPFGRERMIKKGQEVVWIARPTEKADRWNGVKALLDTQANRKALGLAPATQPASGPATKPATQPAVPIASLLNRPWKELQRELAAKGILPRDVRETSPKVTIPTYILSLPGKGYGNIQIVVNNGAVDQVEVWPGNKLPGFTSKVAGVIAPGMDVADVEKRHGKPIHVVYGKEGQWCRVWKVGDYVVVGYRGISDGKKIERVLAYHIHLLPPPERLLPYGDREELLKLLKSLGDKQAPGASATRPATPPAAPAAKEFIDELSAALSRTPQQQAKVQAWVEAGNVPAPPAAPNPAKLASFLDSILEGNQKAILRRWIESGTMPLGRATGGSSPATQPPAPSAGRRY